jgi:hypothetical protein
LILDPNLLRSSPNPHLSSSTINHESTYVRVRYEFRFTSLIAPSHVSSGSVLSLGQRSRDSKRSQRALFKKSYLLASWFYYLARKDSYRSIAVDNSKGPRLAILPSRQIIYTLTKAPMAHKTNSKEQFLLKYYNFKLSADLRLDSTYVPSSVTQGALALQIIENKFPVFETNVLFLKYAKILYPFSSNQFFTTL